MEERDWTENWMRRGERREKDRGWVRRKEEDWKQEGEEEGFGEKKLVSIRRSFMNLKGQ